MSQSTEDFVDSVYETQNTQHNPGPAPDGSVHFFPSLTVHPGNTETHGPNVGNGDSVASLPNWDPQGMNQHAGTTGASGSEGLQVSSVDLQSNPAQAYPNAMQVPVSTYNSGYTNDAIAATQASLAQFYGSLTVSNTGALSMNIPGHPTHTITPWTHFQAPVDQMTNLAMNGSEGTNNTSTLNQHAEASGPSGSNGIHGGDPAWASYMNNFTGFPGMDHSELIAAFNSGHTTTPQGFGPLSQLPTFNGPISTSFMGPALHPAMPPPLTPDQIAMLGNAGSMVNEAEAIIAHELALGRVFPRYPGPSREEAVRFVEGLHRVDLETLAQDDRVSYFATYLPLPPPFRRLFFLVPAKTNSETYAGLWHLSR